MTLGPTHPKKMENFLPKRRLRDGSSVQVYSSAVILSSLQRSEFLCKVEALNPITGTITFIHMGSYMLVELHISVTAQETLL